MGRVKTVDHPVWCKVNNSYSIRKGRFCVPTNNNSKGYWRVGIQINGKQKHFAIHRLVAKAFIPNPDNLPQINHIDGNKNNNCVSNLEWCTAKYNSNYGSRNCRMANGHKKKVAKYDASGRLVDKYNSAIEASIKNGCDASRITKCCRGERKLHGGWAWKYV
jgi:hypothetical protein